MAGIKITNLPEQIGIKNDDNFIISRSNNTGKIKGDTLIESFSGVKNAINYGSGINIYKGSINATNGAIGTTLQFNTLSANNGINCNLAGSLITVSLDSSVSNKINSQVTTSGIATGAVTPEKMSGTLSSVATKTGTQSIAAYTTQTITGLSATVTPPSILSKVMLTGTLSIGSIYSGIILKRTINGTTTNLAVGIDSDAMTQVTFVPPRNYGDYNAASFPLNYIDSPNTTSPVTYSIDVMSTWGYVTYVNRGYSEANAAYSSRSISQIAAIVLP